MHLFSLNGYHNEMISMELKEILGFPNSISLEGGYDIICTLKIDAGCCHVICEKLYSATGALFRFYNELKECCDKLEGQAEYRLLWENNLCFKVVMAKGGHAVITGAFQERSDKKNIFQFEIETDQSFFPTAIRDIENLKETIAIKCL